MLCRPKSGTPLARVVFFRELKKIKSSRRFTRISADKIFLGFDPRKPA
jgi:hypothetical protein